MTIKNHQLEKSISIIVIATLFAFILFTNKDLHLLSGPEKVEAQVPVFLPFGGFVFNVIYCTCSANAIVMVGPPVGGWYVFQPGFTRVFEYYQIPRAGVWLLGNYVPGGTCWVWAGKSCFPIPAQGTISIVGTSI